MAIRDLVANVSPPFLSGDVGARYMYTPAAELDAQIERVEQGVRASMPEKCDPSCLSSIGRDRSTVRGVYETTAGFAHRCKTAIYDWHFAGIPHGLIQILLGVLAPIAPMIRVVWAAHRNVVVRTQWEWVEDGAIPGTPPTSISGPSTCHPYHVPWKWDTIDNRRRFYVILYVNQTGTPWCTSGTVYGTGRKYGDGHLYGFGDVQQSQLAALQDLVKPWKAAHSRCDWIIVSFDDALFDPLNTDTLPANATLPDGTWGHFGWDVSGHYTIARSQSARYIAGVG